LVLLPAGAQQYQVAGQTMSGTVVQLQWQVGCVAYLQMQHFLKQHSSRADSRLVDVVLHL
jgi:hypothetical protein